MVILNDLTCNQPQYTKLKIKQKALDACLKV